MATAGGIAGDSGMSSGVYLLALQGPSRERLVSDARWYQQAMTHRRLWRAVTRPTICPGAYCTAVNLGLDNRWLLPPFLPVQRNQDGVFGALLRSCAPDGCFGFLPWLLRHEPSGPRTVCGEDLERHGCRLHSGQIVQTLVRAAGRSVPGPDRGKNLAGLGRTLAAWAAEPAGAFLEMIRHPLREYIAGLASHLGSQLHWSGGRPRFWAADVERMLAGWPCHLTSQEFGLPTDLIAAFGIEQALPALQRVVYRLGELLQVWPDLVAAAAGLKARGIRLAQPV